MLKRAIRAGLRPNEFYYMTIAELGFIFSDYAEKMKFENENKVQLAIITAYYTAAFERKKKLPKLKDCLIKTEKTKVLQTENQMFETIKMINAMYGGEIIGSST